MTKYLYTGHHVQAYPDILVPAGDDEPPVVLVAHPGDEREFEDAPPGDGRWVEVSELLAKGGVIKPNPKLATVGE